MRGYPTQVLDDHAIQSGGSGQGTGTFPFLTQSSFVAPTDPLVYHPAHLEFPLIPYTSHSTNFAGVGLGNEPFNRLGSHHDQLSGYSDDQGSANQTVPVAQPSFDFEIPRGEYLIPYWNMDASNAPIFCLPAEPYTSNQQGWSAEGCSG